MADDDSMSDDDQLDVRIEFNRDWIVFSNVFYFQIRDNTKHIASIRLGQVDIDCWFHSPYITLEENSNEKDRSVEKLFICEFCLRYFLNSRKYRQHIVNEISFLFINFACFFFLFKNECKCRHPPGRKIYEDPNGLIVYEIDGTTSQLYCQCLCLLAKLFLERKTIYFDVSPFLFYVLVEADKKNKNTQHIIGYFSKV